MRKLGIVLMILWGFAVGLLVVAHEFPERFENFLTTLNEKIGIEISSDIVYYEVGSAIAVLVMPFVLLLLIHFSTGTVQQLHEELRQSREDVQVARSILRGMEDKSGGVERGLAAVARDSLADDVAALEKRAGTIEQAVTQAGQKQAQLLKSLGPRMQALQERLQKAKEATSALQQGDTNFRAQMDAVDDGCVDLKDGLSELEGDDDPARQLDAFKSDVDDITARIQELETLSPRLTMFKDALGTLQQRFKQVQDAPGQGDIGSAIEDLQIEFDGLKEELEGAEKDGDGDFVDAVDEWEGELPDLKERVEALEKLGPRITTFAQEVKALRERLEKADGDETLYLSKIVGNVQTDKEDFENDLRNAERTCEDDGDLADVVDEWDDLGDLKDRVKALEDLGPRVKQVQADLKILSQRLEVVEGTDRLVTSVKRLKEQLEGALDDLNVPDDDAIDALESERDELQGRLERLEKTARRVTAVHDEITTLEQRVGDLAKLNGTP